MTALRLRKAQLLLMLGAAATAITGCSDPIEVSTFNAGLAHGYVPYATERLDLITSGVASLDSDVVCLQEVWTQADIDAIISATAGTYAHSYYDFMVSTEIGEGCSQSEAQPLLACAEEHCTDAVSLKDCALEYCAAEYGSVSAVCAGCLGANIDAGIEGLMAACLGGGAAFSYGGHNGVLLLSKHALKNTASTKLSSIMVQRAVIRADISAGAGVSVYCTHIAADLSSEMPNYPGTEFSSFAEEQAAQITQALAWIDASSNEEIVVLTGDFNTGPQTGSVAAELPDNYKILTSAGFKSAYVDSGAGKCTWCGSNTLVGGTDSHDNLIDHILVKGADVSSSKRVLDKTSDILDDKNIVITTHSSDHFGLSATLD